MNAQGAGSRHVDCCRLIVEDAHGAMSFDAVIGAPEKVYVAHHRQARGVHRLLDRNGKNTDGCAPQDTLWEVRAYVRMTAMDGAATYEPEGWQDLDDAEIRRRRVAFFGPVRSHA